MSETQSLSKVSAGSIVESVVIGGDLSKLTAEQRVGYYKSVCESIGLNPLTKPFDYITLNGKLTLYARKDATEQLRKRDGVSVSRLDQQIVNDICIVTAYVSAGTRTDASTGAVSIKGLGGESLANAMMKAETKAKRRATLSICGLGMLDESETDALPMAKQTIVDIDTGEIIDAKPAAKIEINKPEPVYQPPAPKPAVPDEPKAEYKAGPMSYEQACEVQGTDGKRYGNCTDLELKGKRLGITKALNKPDVDPAKQSQYQNKLEAIKVLLDVPESERLERAGQMQLSDAA